MDNISIRIANMGDAEIILKYDHHVPEDIISDKISRHEILIACHDDNFAGWLRYGLFWDLVPFMNMLFLLPEYRGKGFGRQIVQYWEKLMIEQNYKVVFTSTQQDESAQHFYNALGYGAIGGFILPDDVYEIILSKNLEARHDCHCKPK